MDDRGPLPPPKVMATPVCSQTGGCNYFGDHLAGGYGQTIHGVDTSSIRGWRVTIGRGDAPWYLPYPHSDFATAWIGIENVGSDGRYNGDFIQAGYIKGEFAPAPGCSGNTGGDIRPFWYRIKLNGTPAGCWLGSPVPSGASNTFNLQRCNGTD